MNIYNFQTDTITYKEHKIENFFKDFLQQDYIKDYVKSNLIMLCVGGSHAYGLNTETSDLDIRGIFKDNINQILGVDKIEQLQASNNDVSIFSLTKALQLIIDQNPNMHELLWIDEEEILYATEEYWYIRSRRAELLSSLAKHKYSGYAMSQLKRIRGHSKWLTKEQEGKFKNKPNILNYLTHIDSLSGVVHNFKDIKVEQKHLYFTKVKDEIYSLWFDKNSEYPLVAEGNSYIPVQDSDGMRDINYEGTVWFNKSQFQKDLEEYSNWKKWKENRNEKRHKLEEKYGYDTKHAAHTFRLLNMGLEILRDQEVKVKRPDAKFLLDIRNGKYTYEWIVEEAEKLDSEVLLKAYEETTLPKSVNKKIYLEIVKKVLKL